MRIKWRIVLSNENARWNHSFYLWGVQVTDCNLTAFFRPLRHQRQCCSLAIYLWYHVWWRQLWDFCSSEHHLEDVRSESNWLWIKGENRFSLVTLRNKCVPLKCKGKFTAFHSVWVFVFCRPAKALIRGKSSSLTIKQDDAITWFNVQDPRSVWWYFLHQRRVLVDYL